MMAAITAFLVLLSLLPGTAAFLTPPSSSAAAVVASRRVELRSISHAPLALSGLPHGVANDDIVDDDSDAVTTTTRRSFLVRTGAAGGALAALSMTSRPPVSRAAETTSASSSSSYEDADYGFRLRVPSSWERSEQTLSGRRKAIFYTDPSSKTVDGNIETLCIVAYTPVRDDFTSLSSFGSVDEVGQSTILPKELAGGDGSTSRMISSISQRGAYYFDYVSSPTVPKEKLDSTGVATRTLKPQRFRTVFALLPPVGNAAAGMTLVTITLQTSEDRYVDNMKGMFDGIIDSYEKIK